MEKFFTKMFIAVMPECEKEIDTWLNSFYKDKKPYSQYSISVVGYVANAHTITITIKEFSLPK